MSKEAISGDSQSAAKTYDYDAHGLRLAMTNTPKDTSQSPETYTYGYDVHGSVSLLLKDTGEAKASYGYSAYGALDDKMSSGDKAKQSDGDIEDPLNAYRYTAKRFDTGSQTIDMGARRFGPDFNRFLQVDQYMGALADLSLSTEFYEAAANALNDFMTGGRDPGDFDDEIAEYASDAGIDPRTLWAIVARESNSARGWVGGGWVKRVVEAAEVAVRDGRGTIGIAQMNRTTFDNLAEDFPQIQGAAEDNVGYADLAHDERLAIRAIAYRLSKFQETVLSKRPNIGFMALQFRIASGHKDGEVQSNGSLNQLNWDYINAEDGGITFPGAFQEAHAHYCEGSTFVCTAQ